MKGQILENAWWRSAFNPGDIIVEIGDFTRYVVVGVSMFGFEMGLLFAPCDKKHVLTYEGPWVASEFVKVGEVGNMEDDDE